MTTSRISPAALDAIIATANAAIELCPTDKAALEARDAAYQKKSRLHLLRNEPSFNRYITLTTDGPSYAIDFCGHKPIKQVDFHQSCYSGCEIIYNADSSVYKFSNDAKNIIVVKLMQCKDYAASLRQRRRYIEDIFFTQKIYPQYDQTNFYHNFCEPKLEYFHSLKTRYYAFLLMPFYKGVTLRKYVDEQDDPEKLSWFEKMR